MRIWGTFKSGIRKLTVITGEKSKGHVHSVPSDWMGVHAGEARGLSLLLGAEF